MKMIKFNTVCDLFNSMCDCPLCKGKLDKVKNIDLNVYIPGSKAIKAVIDEYSNCWYYDDHDNEINSVSYKGEVFASKIFKCSCDDYYYGAVFVIDCYLKELKYIYLMVQTFYIKKHTNKHDVMRFRFNVNKIELYKFNQPDEKITIPYFQKIVVDPYEIYNRMKKIIIFA